MLIPISQTMQLPFIHLTVRRPTWKQRPGVLPSPKITPRPRRRRHGLSYKQLVAAAVPAAPAGRPSPEAQGPGLAWIPGLSSESPITSGPFFDPACLPQCGSPRGWSIAGCHWLAPRTEDNDAISVVEQL